MPKVNFGPSQFQAVGGLNPGRAVFDLSNARALPADFGYLYPILAEECVPGDVFSLSADVVARMMPTIAPIMHEVNIYIHYWFVPFRLLWPKVDETGDDWESYITGGDTGLNDAVLPRWYPSPTSLIEGSLWDYFGLPTNAPPDVTVTPYDFLRSGYNLIWNEWYRDQVLEDKVDLDSEFLNRRSWEKDYFTSSLVAQQKGIPPALPISGTTSAEFPGDVVIFGQASGGGPLPYPGFGNPTISATDGDPWAFGTAGAAPGFGPVVNANLIAPKDGVVAAGTNGLNNNTVDLSVASTFDISDLRMAFQVQKWMERNMRAGSRYTEYLQAHFGVSPRDSRLQRPEYIGGVKSPVIVSEVLQTSQTDTTPQGTMAGHGISVARQHGGRYRVEEYGMIFGLLSVMPRAMYTQGVDRMFIRNSRYDFYAPEFAHLSEQGVYKGELFIDGSPADAEIFGYQGRNQEYRSRQSKAVSKLRGSLGYWNLGRKFVTRPVLNDTFIHIENSVLKERILAVPSEPAFLVTVGNRVIASRPMPGIPEPGLIDHF